MKELIYYLGTIISVSSLAYHFISRFWFASEEIKEALADNTKRMDKYNEKYWRHTAISLIGCVLGCILIILGI